MKKLLTILTLALLSQASASTKEDCKEACEDCQKAKCDPYRPTPTPTLVPSQPPASSLDVKVVSLNPVGGTIHVSVLPGLPPQTIKFLLNVPTFMMQSNQAVTVRYTEGVATVNEATHILTSTELTSSAGYQALPAGVVTGNIYTMTVPLYYGTGKTYRLKVCAIPVDAVTHADLAESNTSNNCMTGEYYIID